MAYSPAVLVTTLGAEAPVIPITTQLLLTQDVPLARVEVLHTIPVDPAIRSALTAVEAAFAGYSQWPPLITTQLPVTDVLAPGELDEVFGLQSDVGGEAGVFAVDVGRVVWELTPTGSVVYGDTIG